MKALALKYRPTNWDEVTEQGVISDILMHQIETNTIKHGYLFCGPAGCGKTTAARIFANGINNCNGQPIELDAASNNSVEDIRKLIENAQTKSLDSAYKVFILDEAHMITTQGWNAFLKTLEEPPATAIFILCTTDPQKIPATILSRVQRYNFQKISNEGIMSRLEYICKQESFIYEEEALQYICNAANGGMRDAITLLDKCVSYSENVSVSNVVDVLGITSYEVMLNLLQTVINKDTENMIILIENIYDKGTDLKLFIKSFFEFILKVNIYNVTRSNQYSSLPSHIVEKMQSLTSNRARLYDLMNVVLQLTEIIKQEQNPKPVIIATLMIHMEEG